MDKPSNKQFFQPDRLLYLDGVIQSTRQGLAAYHEALVQPAMFAHPNPKRIAIVGGGECATLRETLKHSTVEKVIMVEIDPIIVDVSKIYLEEWNDCSMFGDGSIRYCMDDPRVEMYHLDALQWFRDRYSNEKLFDVVILDALDPQNAVDFVEALYGDGPFMNSLYNSLTDNGVLLTQVGE
ncbi:S-adenosyl-L-methionine-dependent methyltransferase, partial [Fragilariopsis cylindrus CCMP1102]